MAFDPLNITKLAEFGGVTWWDYLTTDTNATVAAAGYFSNYGKILDVNDKIWVKASDFSVLYYVSAVTRLVNIQGVVVPGAGALSVTVVPITATAGSGLSPSAINGGPLSVVGRSANTAGADADISATAASAQVLRESGSTIGWGTINDLASFGTNVYSTGTWTPVITFTTPGDLNVVYSNQVGVYYTIGRIVIAFYQYTTSTFTYATAAGQHRLTGLPFTVDSASGSVSYGITGNMQGITYTAGYTQVICQTIATTTTAALQQIGSAVATAALTTANMPSGTQQQHRGTLIYISA